MANELFTSNIPNNSKAIASYQRNGSELPVSSIAEYVMFTKLVPVLGTPIAIKYPAADLRIIAIHAEQITAEYTLKIFSDSEVKIFETCYKFQMYDPAYLMLPKGYRLELIPQAETGVLRIAAQQIAIFEEKILP